VIFYSVKGDFVHSIRCRISSVSDFAGVVWHRHGRDGLRTTSLAMEFVPTQARGILGNLATGPTVGILIAELVYWISSYPAFWFGWRGLCIAGLLR